MRAWPMIFIYLLTGAMAASQGQTMLAVCISDVNKLLLINSPGFTALLVMHPALLLSQICSPLHY